MTHYQHTPVTVHNRRAVIVGGTSGIGRAIALGFATEGADVIATSRDEGRVKETATLLEERGVETAEVTCDAREAPSLERVRDVAEETLGGVDVVVASQGAISREALATIDEREWDRVIDIGLNGVWRITQTFMPALERGGNIINISSLTARLAIANAPAYTAAKGGLEAFTRASAKELAPDIRVNAIAPGFVLTPQNEGVYAQGTTKREKIDERTPLGRVASPDEIVGAAIFLASPAASFVTGSVVTVDGGFANSAL